jgi:hypothetical protein
MRKVLWILAAVGVAAWTVVSIGAYLAIDVFGDALKGASGHVPGFPIETFSMPWFVQTGREFGFAATVVVWGFGTLVILSVPMIVSLFFRGRRPKARDRDDDRFRLDPRSMRLPGAGRDRGPYGRLPDRVAASDLAKRLLGRRSR